MAQKLWFPILYTMPYCNCTSIYICKKYLFLEPDKIVEFDKALSRDFDWLSYQNNKMIILLKVHNMK